MSYNSLKTTAAAAAVISVGALAFSGHAEAYWRHHYHHRHVAFVPVASMSAPAPAGYGMNGGYGTCIKRDPVWTTRGWRSDWVIDCAGKGPVMVALPITPLPWWLQWLPWATVTRVTVTVTGVGPSAVCSAVCSAGEAPAGMVQRRIKGAVRENGALFFDANPVRALLAAAPKLWWPFASRADPFGVGLRLSQT